MFSSDQYEALDFGENRRLERFGKLVLDRPCLAAEFPKKMSASRWATADAVFQVDETASQRPNVAAERGVWIAKTDMGRSFFKNPAEESAVNSAAWHIRHDQAVFELRGTPFGHVGVFPEQAENWDAIKAFCQRAHARSAFRILNLFAYTGGSTLAAALGGAEVVHVDAAKNIVAWARKNAELTQIAATQVRWIADDAKKFVRRELKRGNTYHGVILDPPSYGHGANGEIWRFTKHIAHLLFDCFSLLESDFPCFLLLSCHTPGFTLNRLSCLVEEAARAAMAERFVRKRMRLDARTLTLRAETHVASTTSPASLPSGESVMLSYNE